MTTIDRDSVVFTILLVSISVALLIIPILWIGTPTLMERIENDFVEEMDYQRGFVSMATKRTGELFCTLLKNVAEKERSKLADEFWQDGILIQTFREEPDFRKFESHDLIERELFKNIESSKSSMLLDEKLPCSAGMEDYFKRNAPEFLVLRGRLTLNDSPEGNDIQNVWQKQNGFYTLMIKMALDPIEADALEGSLVKQHIRWGMDKWITVVVQAERETKTNWARLVVFGVGLLALFSLLLSMVFLFQTVTPLRRLEQVIIQLEIDAEAVRESPTADVVNISKSRSTNFIPDALQESGPREIRRVIKAFISMLGRWNHLIKDRSTMLVKLSHDLRNDLNTLIRLVEKRHELVEQKDAENAQRQIIDQIQKMTKMADEALYYSAGTAAREEARRIELASLLRTVVDLANEVYEEVRFVGPRRLHCYGRVSALHRAFENLVRNACTYGGSAEVCLFSEDDRIVVEIKDRGPGIPEDERKRVFEPFERLDLSRNRETVGTGLGLTIARDVFQYVHQGSIELLDRVGGGLTVRVNLPQERRSESNSVSEVTAGNTERST